MHLNLFYLFICYVSVSVNAGSAAKGVARKDSHLDYLEKNKENLISAEWIHQQLYNYNLQFHQNVPRLMIHYAMQGNDKFFNLFLKRASLVNWIGSVPVYRKHVLNLNDLLDVSRYVLNVPSKTVPLTISDSLAEYLLWRIGKFDFASTPSQDVKSVVESLVMHCIRYYAYTGKQKQLQSLFPYVTDSFENIDLLEDAIFLAIDKGDAVIVSSLMKLRLKNMPWDAFLFYSFTSRSYPVAELLLHHMDDMNFKDTRQGLEKNIFKVIGLLLDKSLFDVYNNHVQVKADLTPDLKQEMLNTWEYLHLNPSLGSNSMTRMNYLSGITSLQWMDISLALARAKELNSLQFLTNHQLLGMKKVYLYESVRIGHVEAIDFALTRDLNLQEYISDWIRIAVKYGRVGILQKFIQRGMLPHDLVYGLEKCIEFGKWDMLEFFLTEMDARNMMIPIGIYRKSFSHKIVALRLTHHSSIQSQLQILNWDLFLKELVDAQDIQGLQFVFRNFLTVYFDLQDIENVMQYASDNTKKQVLHFYRKEVDFYKNLQAHFTFKFQRDIVEQEVKKQISEYHANTPSSASHKVKWWHNDPWEGKTFIH